MPTVLSDDDDGLYAACLLLQCGRQVVIPTETVYGLAANALDYDAVAEIFRIKGRPSTNPLIVHVHSIEQAGHVAVLNDYARKLAGAFWPGPLTIVMEASPAIAENVTAGGSTVGVRMPNHDVALRLIKMTNLPLAAPSANKSEGISPTTPTDVLRSLGKDSPPIVDGGACAVGIESTVIDVTTDPPRILRPGVITRSQIEAALGVQTAVGGGEFSIERSPGQMSRHYSPTTDAVIAELLTETESLPANSALIYFSDGDINLGIFSRSVKLPAHPEGYAAGLYAALHELDQGKYSTIVIESPPDTEEWHAIRDRLRRATGASA